jgi:hypothetical protein
VSSGLAPVLLVGGWTLADALQRVPFDPVRETISALAARDADPRWLMTAALVGVGACHLTTALSLRTAGLPGRVVLGLGGIATLGVAAAPLPSGDGGSAAHTGFAATAFLALAAWPAFALRRVARAGSDGVREAPDLPWRPVVALPVTAALLGLVGWFGAELGSDVRVGLAERVAAAAQALWPLVAVRLAVRSRA